MRVLITLVGDVQRKADMSAKYGTFFDALSKKVDIVGIHDVSLHGMERYWNAIRTFSFTRQRWKERFFRNVPAFQSRSKAFVRFMQRIQPSPDVILQLGVLFDSTWGKSSIPVVLYTDNTSAITARHPGAGRFAFHAWEQADWMAHEKECYRRAAHICVRASGVQHSLAADYGIPFEKISVIGGGVNYAPLPDLPLRDLNQPPIVLFIGQDFQRKGGDLVLKAFERTRARNPKARLLIVTKGPIPSMLPMGGVEHVEIDWNREALASLYRSADLFILPSRQETWGDVLLEAMAFGMPCIGVTGEAMEDIIQPGVTGELVPPENLDGLTEALTNLLVDRSRCSRMGLAARQRVEMNFTWEHIVDRLLPILSEVRS